MSQIDIEISASWRELGLISAEDDGRLRFPKVPTVPGLYRFDFEVTQRRYVYVGETVELARRLQHYRTPGPSQRTNQRLNKLISQSIKDGGRVVVAIITDDPTLKINGQQRAADLGLKPERALLENAAIISCQEEGLEILNL